MQPLVITSLIMALVTGPAAAQVSQRPVLIDQPRPMITPVSTGATEEIDRLQRRYLEMEAKKVTESKAQAEQFEALDASYSDLLTKSTAAAISQLKPLLDALDQRMKALEEATRKSQSAAMELDQLKYLTGHSALVLIIDKLAALDFGTRFGEVLSALERRSNPASYREFTSAVEGIQKKLGQSALTLPTKAGSGLLSNPYVAVAYSIGSLLFAKLQSPERAEKYQVLMCTLDYSTRTDSQRSLVNSRLGDLLKDISTTREGAVTLFDDYVKLVGFEGGHVAWHADRLKRGVDPIRALTESFFSGLQKLQQDAQPKIQEVRYNFERVKSQITSYERLLTEVDAFFAALETAASIAPDAVCTQALSKSEFGQLDVTQKIQDLKEAFKRANFHVPPDALGLLYKQ